MISPKAFIDCLERHGISFYTGVPDSLLKDVCGFISSSFDSKHHIIAANEGGAIGLAAGYHLATGKIACVYMQNSGEGNAINPLTSLTDKEVYRIPVLLLIGWRGEPGIHDEPQHIKQGKITLPLLDTLGIKYSVLKKDREWAGQVSEAVLHMRKTGEVYALVIEKGTFTPGPTLENDFRKFEMSREEALEAVADTLKEKDVIVSTTGMISRELFEYRVRSHDSHERDFLTVGSMGHASQIALGIALEKSDRKVWCLDGDGALLMHLGSMAIIGNNAPSNFIHVVFNNGAHDSVGGQPTVGLDIDLPVIAKAMGYNKVLSVSSRCELEEGLSLLTEEHGPIFFEIKVNKGHRKNLGRPTSSPIENKNAFISFLSDA
jgi:phosphonopyruvate decarboxylase